MQGALAAYRADRMLTSLRFVVWEAALLYCVTLFVHAWNADSGSASVFLLVMNALQLCFVMAACITTLRR